MAIKRPAAQEVKVQAPASNSVQSSPAGAATAARSVVLRPGDLPAEAMGELQQDAGKGVSTLARDNIIPMIYVLQPLSPQVQDRDKDRFIEGAKPGFFWLRNSPVPIVDGDLGMAFQPCHFKRDAVEWIPRDMGGGFVARHSFIGPDESLDEMAKRMKWDVEPSDNKRRPPTYRNGDNEIKEVRYHAGFVHGGLLGLADAAGLVLPFVIPFAGTGHGVSRGWMTSINQHTFPGDSSKVLPACTRLYKLTTKWRKNAAGEWAQVFVDDTLGWVPGFPQELDAYRRGIALHDAIERGEKELETPDNTGVGGGEGGGEDTAGAADRAGV